VKSSYDGLANEAWQAANNVAGVMIGSLSKDLQTSFSERITAFSLKPEFIEIIQFHWLKAFHTILYNRGGWSSCPVRVRRVTSRGKNPRV
jgi:hypothetical protein